MIHWLKNRFYQIQVLLLAIVRPTELFDRINQLSWYQSALHQWVDEHHFKVENTVLETGCATGALTNYMAQSGLIVTGTDFSSNMIKRANKQYKNINFKVDDVLNLSIESNSFNAVIATSLINIINDKQLAINELARCCQHGGIVSILVPSDHFNDKQLKNLLTTINESGFSEAALIAWHNNAPKMAATDVYNLFEHAGLVHISTLEYLQGMVISVTATKPLK